MNTWDRWRLRPQTLWWRKLLFQIHLWTGIGLGLYVVLMSVSGSAVVFRRELGRALSQEPRVLAGMQSRLAEEDLRQAVQRAYPGFAATRIFFRKNPDQAAEVWLERGVEKRQRLFNPYTGEDLGDSIRPGLRLMLWLVDFHDNLLAGSKGRKMNGLGGGLTTLLCITGIIIWWPGIAAWRKSLSFRWAVNPKGINWVWHSALGFWAFLFCFMWALTGIYLSIPETFNSIVDYFEPGAPPQGKLRFGDQFLYWLAQAHFGRFSGLGVKTVWTILGLAPVLLFITGLVMWWQRVLWPWMRRGKES